jgi:hypothetical protein
MVESLLSILKSVVILFHVYTIVYLVPAQSTDILVVYVSTCILELTTKKLKIVKTISACTENTFLLLYAFKNIHLVTQS